MRLSPFINPAPIGTYKDNHMLTTKIVHYMTILLLLPLFFPAAAATPVFAGTASLVPLSNTVFHDTVSKKDWQIERANRTKEPEQVQNYLRKLNREGNEGWRLPTKEELHTLFSRFDLKENGQVKIRMEGKYWLKDNTANVYVGSWEIGDQCEPTRSFFRGDAGYIRAIRP